MTHDTVKTDGALSLRRFFLTRQCEVAAGHKHDYDHDTIVIKGKIEIIQDGIPHPKIYGPGDVIFIAASSIHAIKAIEVPVEYLCVFSHRDLDGRIVERYVGNEREHQAFPDKPSR